MDFRVEIVCYCKVNGSKVEIRQQVFLVGNGCNQKKTKHLHEHKANCLDFFSEADALFRSSDLHRSTATTLHNPKRFNQIEI